VGLWFVDGHADYLDGSSSPTGEAADMELGDRGPAWLHLDLDALDEAAHPAVSYPQPRGLDWDTFVALARPLLASDALVGASVADFNPDLDEDGAHARRVVDALARALQ
jgi:arginase